ncbi:MAG: type II secretion system protein, partial [Phycisphaeraceae bacterium]
MSGSIPHIPSEVQRKPLQRDRLRPAFSMIDLLVSLAVIAVLVAFMLPTLAMAHEAANRIKCASNLRQVGVGLQMFVFDNRSRLPSTTFIDPNQPTDHEIHETVHLRLSADMIQQRSGNTTARRSTSTRPMTLDRWDGLGWIYERDYISDPRVFYCPSHEGAHDYERYLPQWQGAPGAIVGNYQYRIPDGQLLFAQITPEKTLVADAMRSQEEYNHGTGNNMLKADMSVLWFDDRAGLIFAALAADPDAPGAAQGVAFAWSLMDSTNPGAPGSPSNPNANNSNGVFGS